MIFVCDINCYKFVNPTCKLLPLYLGKPKNSYSIALFRRISDYFHYLKTKRSTDCIDIHLLFTNTGRT